MLTKPERLAIQMREAKMLEDIRARWDARAWEMFVPMAEWSFFDRVDGRRESNFGREDYGL
jgi:hypothetical protein